MAYFSDIATLLLIERDCEKLYHSLAKECSCNVEAGVCTLTTAS